MKVIRISLTLRLLRRKVNWLSWPRERSLASGRYWGHSLLTSTGLQKSMRYGSFLAWTSRLPKSRVRARLDELDCFELVVMVDWDDEIDKSVVAVDAVEMDTGLDSWFDEIDDAVVAVKTDAGLDSFNAVTGGSSLICEILFFTTDLPVFALTGMAWLVVALDVVFIMMGMLWWFFVVLCGWLGKKVTMQHQKNSSGRDPTGRTFAIHFLCRIWPKFNKQTSPQGTMVLWIPNNVRKSWI